MLRPARFLPLLLFTLPVAFFIYFYFYPLATILEYSFTGMQNAEQLVEPFRQPFLWHVLWFTLWQAAASTALTLLFGLPLAYLFARYQFPGKSLLRALTTIPFVMPTVVVAAAFTVLLGNNGMINQWLQNWLGLATPPLRIQQTIWIILLAHAFYNTSIIIRTVGGFWANLNPRLSEAAAILGARPWRAWLTITLPLLMPSIIASSTLVFLFCFTSFGVVLILGGLRFATLEVEIYRQAVSLFDLPTAALLSLIQMALTFTLMFVYTRLQANTSRALDFVPQRTNERRPHHPAEILFLLAGLGVTFLLLLAPLVALAWRSLTVGAESVTFAYYLELTVDRRQSAFFVAPWVAIRNSLIFALATMCLSLLLGGISAYLIARPRSWLTMFLDPLFLLPLGTSAVTLGLGYILAMGGLRTSPYLIPIAHTLIAAPFVMRTVLPALRSINPRLREAAAVHGASPLQVWRQVDLPILSRAMLVGAAYAFTISLGEFGASLLISRPDTPTMPVIIYRALSQPGIANLGQALAMSTILMIVSAIGLLAIERFRLPGTGEF
jgi:thiamine transport system permease protein